MNVQNLLSKDAKFNIYKRDLKILFNFINTELNRKKNYAISNSKLFFKERQEDIFFNSFIEIKVLLL